MRYARFAITGLICVAAPLGAQGQPTTIAGWVEVLGSDPNSMRRVAAAESSVQMIPWSQYGSVTQRLGETEIQIRYRRPVARGRELFGVLVKWDEPWTDIHFQPIRTPSG